MRRNTVALVWLGGILLAAVVYVSGPGRFIMATIAGLDHAVWAFETWVGFFAAQAFDLVRAAAIALFAVFLALGVIAGQRGRGGGMVGVTVLFLGLVGLGGYESRFCWLAALVVAAAGALNMTRRLTEPAGKAGWRSRESRA
ncbi:MAG: hypothetical protein ABI224_02645 [Acetobacteraceae bacterium]